jgi:hypothetical protein
VQETLRLCGQIRRMARTGEEGPIDMAFMTHGLKGSTDAALGLFTNGQDEPATMQELEPYLVQVFSAAAYALGVGSALLELADDIQKGTADG